MFTEIDKILYPNRCEVVQAAPQRFIYAIFKNGSSSINDEARLNGWKVLLNEQIKVCDEIEIYLREPLARLASGTGTFHDDMVEKDLDSRTVLYFMENFLFLNRHYIPQLHWLVSLGRYLKPTTLLNLKDLSQLKELTNIDKGGRSPHQSKLSNFASLNQSVFYLELDKCLYNMVGERLTLRSILTRMRSEHKQAYDHVFGHAKRLIDVLP